MSQNVFKPLFGNRPDQVVGRTAVLQQLYDGLRGEPGSRGRAVLVLGQRGMGKTALLLEVADHAQELGYIAVRVTSRSTMLDDIVGITQLEGEKALGRAVSRISSLSASAFGFSLGLTFTDTVERTQGFRVKLELLCDRLAEAGLGLLILVDEAQPSMEELRTLTTSFQELVGEGKNIALVMAGLPGSVSKVLNDKTLTFLNRAQKIHLGLLAIPAVRIYYEDVFERMGRSADPATLSRAAELTQGFPYLLQLLGYYLVQYSDLTKSVDQRTLDAAFEMARADLASDVFEASLKPLSAKDLEFLRAMAQDEGVSTVSDIRARLNVADNYFQPYRARLLASGIVESPRAGELAFTIPYLADYLAGGV